MCVCVCVRVRVLCALASCWFLLSLWTLYLKSECFSDKEEVIFLPKITYDRKREFLKVTRKPFLNWPK